MNLIRMLCLATTLISGMPSVAKAEARRVPRVKVGQPPFHEYRPAYLSYSGEDVVGLVSGPLNLRSIRPAIVVSGVRPSDQTICVHMEQSNGGYLADFSIANPRVGSTFQLDLPSAVLKSDRFRSGEIAIRAQVSSKATCTDNDTFLLASWGTGRDGSALLVNAKRASYVAASVGTDSATECIPLEDVLGDKRVKTSSYGYVCRVRLAGRCGDTQRVSVQGIDGAVVRKPVFYTVRNPC